MAVRPRGTAFPGRPRLFAPAAVIVLLLLVLGGVYVAQYTDYLWFQEAQHANVFTTVLKTKLVLFASFGLLMGVVIAANIAVAYRKRPPFQPVSMEQQNLERYRVALEPYLVPVLVVLSLFFGVFAGLSAASRWRTWLLFSHRQPFGVEDAQFHKDISYFTFTYPFQRFLLGFVLVVLVLSLLAAVVTHYLFGGIRLQTQGDRFSVPARVHLSVMIGLIVATKAVAYYLDRYGLAFSKRGIVEGASYTDVHAALPAKTMLMVIAALCALLFFANIVVRNVILPAGALALLVVSSIAVGGIYPFVVQKYTVQPNQLARESDYIRRNIDATRLAYGIDDTKVKLDNNYPGVSTATKAALRNDTGTVPNIRLLDPNLLGSTFTQNQRLRTYFTFNDSLDIDRYTVAGKTQDYVVAARELDVSRVPAAQQNWVNLHLAYTHGNGVVAAPANQTDPNNPGQPAYTVGEVPPVDSSPGKVFTLDHSQVYYGEQSPAYSIVNTKQPEIDGPAADQDSAEGTSHYSGPGGIKLATGFRKLLYALKFRDKNILLSGSLTSSSKIMYDRSPTERVQKLAPFLTLDGDPYPVVVDKKLLWVVDGYTTSSGYPYSQSTSFGKVTTDSTGTRQGNEVNYIRNSVKATVDAYTGRVNLYAWDEKDPVLKTWRSVFPGLVKDNDAIDAVPGLREHLRYPEDLFKVQRELLARYHVQDVQTFFQGTDQWDIPSDPTKDATRVINSGATPGVVSSTSPAQPPYYVLVQMPGQTAPTFSLTTTFVARNATNLTAFAAVSSDPANYGEISVLVLPKNRVVDGPEQVANTFESNPTISTQLSLLRGGGSEVELGNLLTLPVGQGLLYVEPVYTRAKKSPSFDILSKVIVSFGNKIAYEDSLSAALNSLFGEGAVVTPTPSPGTGTPPADNTVAQLIAQAQSAYDDGQAALKRGDFAAYGAAQSRLKAALDQLATKTGTTGATPTPTASP